MDHAPEHIRSSVERFSEQVRALGYAELVKRYDDLLSRA
jgi:hypothetical protein